MGHKQRLREVIDEMTDAEADATLRWIEQRRELDLESPPPRDGVRTNAEMIREDRDR